MSAGARCSGFVTCALLLAIAPLASRTWLAFALLMKLTGAPLPAAVEWRLYSDVSERSASVWTPAGPVRARRYVSTRAHADHAPGVLLLHGVHALGIDEPRLVAFARTLARGGLDVLTPELTALTVYRVDPRLSADIRALALAHAAQTHTAAVGVIGISFAGGLALLAAAEQASSRPIGFVATVGAHDDLVRLCHYYAGADVRGPSGERPDVPPHPYGARVLLRSSLARYVSAGDLPLAQRALDTYLHDQPRQARALALQLSPQGQRFMAEVLADKTSPSLSRVLLDTLAESGPQLMAASPHAQLEGLRVPVFLLHGAGDPVIPSIETAYLAREVPRAWLRSVIVSKLLRHAEFPEPPTPAQAWDLVRFVRQLLEAAGSLPGLPP
jgi:pimeloyl-ACP methyl ester carboxylesterase